MLEIYPDHFDCFSDKKHRGLFLLIVSCTLKDKVKIHASKYYQRIEIFYCNPNKTIQPILQRKEFVEADILFLQYQYNYINDSINALPKQRVAIFIDRRSTPMNMELAQHYLNVAHNTDLNELSLKKDLFLKKLGSSTGINYVNSKTKTSAFLKFSPDCLITEICGVLNLGESVSFPCGELALSHYNFINKQVPPLEINGKITLHGYPILQANELGNEDLFNLQKKIFPRLFELKNHPVIARIKDGAITELTPYKNDAEVPISALEELFKIDKDYRILFEFGHGLNSAIKLRDENTNINEMYANNGICVHFGIGSKYAGHPFHLDMICPDTKMEDDQGKSIMVSNNEISLKLKLTTPKDAF